MKNVENMINVQREIILDMVETAKKIKETHNVRWYGLQFLIYNHTDDESYMIENFFRDGELVNQLSEKITRVAIDNRIDIDEEEIIYFDKDCIVFYQNIYNNMPFDRDGKVHCTGRYACQIDEYDEEKVDRGFRPEWEDNYWINDYEEES